MRFWHLLLIGLVVAPAPPLLAQEAPGLPRYESLRFSESRLRRGPGRDHRIDMLFKRRGLPLEVIDEYKEWRRVRDMDGLTGWLHRSQLSPRRFAVVVAERVELRDRPEADATLDALIERNVVLRLESCDDEWCAVSVDDLQGWSLREGLWGLADGETFGSP